MENSFDHIERYFNGTLSLDEVTAFEKRRLTDKDFDNEVNLYQQANKVVRAGARNRMKQKLDEIGKQQEAFTMVETFVKYRSIRKYWYAAASILVLIGLSYLGWNRMVPRNSVTTIAGLYDRYYENPGIDRVIVRSSEEGNIELNWNSALEKYSRQDYEGALTIFKSLLADTLFTYNSTAHFYAGVSFLNLNLPDSAITHFNRVSVSSSFAQDALWYTGLGYLKAGNTTKAAEIFEIIKQSEYNFKKKEVKEILKSISRLE